MSSSEKSAASEHTSLSLPTGKPITLQVGERRFVTRAETLMLGSQFFTALFSGRWDDAQADISYFLDADPQLFEHILRYLRRGVLPIFYDNVKGHDHALYRALLEEAEYFQIARLEDWLRSKRYLHVIQIISSVAERTGSSWLETRDTDEQVEYHPVWQTRQVYICPRGILVHRGNRSACGRQCMNRLGDGVITYEEEQVLNTLVVRKQTVLNWAVVEDEA